MNEKSMVRDLTTGTVWKQLMVFALPFMLANLLQTLYTIVDAAIVGRVVGAEALAAVTTCGILVDFYTLFGMGFASAGQILVAQFVGKNDRNAMSRTIGTLFSFLLLLAVFMSVFCLTTVDLQLRWINVPQESLVAGRIYTITSACGFVLVYGYNCVSSILRGMGDSKHPLIFVAIAAGMNFLLDLLFVVVFHWGTFGAALATILGQGFSFVISLVYLYRHREAFGFDFKLKSFIPGGHDLKLLLRLGGPMALQFSAIVISMLYVNSLINNYGYAAAAVTGIGSKLDGVLRIVSNSMGTAGSAMVAQCVGAGKYERVPKVVRTVLIVCQAEAVIVSLLVFFLPVQVFRMFNQEIAVLELAVAYRGACVVGFLSFGLRAAYNSVVNGIGYASLGLISGIMDGVVARIGLALLFGSALHFGIQGFWYGSALAGFVSAAIVGVYYYSGRWKNRTLITQR